MKGFAMKIIVGGTIFFGILLVTFFYSDNTIYNTDNPNTTVTNTAEEQHIDTPSDSEPIADSNIDKAIDDEQLEDNHIDNAIDNDTPTTDNISIDNDTIIDEETIEDNHTDIDNSTSIDKTTDNTNEKIVM